MTCKKKPDHPAKPTYQPKLDIELHKTIITAVENFLGCEGLTLPSHKKAEVFALLYELYVETGKQIEEGTVERNLKLVA